MRRRRRKPRPIIAPTPRPVGLYSWVCGACPDRGQPSLSRVDDQKGALEHQRFCSFYAAARAKAVAS